VLVCVPSDCFAPVRCAPPALWNHLVFSGDLACSIRAHACSSAVFTLCSSASLLHVALLVFTMNVMYLWFSVLIRSCGFAFCPVAVYSMILCSCRPLGMVLVACDELSLIV
jgi:hypothetical protein